MTFSHHCAAQQKVDDKSLIFSMEDVISEAQKNSLEAFIAENRLAAAYWANENFQASRLPQATLNLYPFNYRRRITEQFDPDDNRFKYFEIQNLSSTASLSLSQNLMFSGGTINMISDLGRLVNYGDLNNEQFSATPIQIGINQPLFGFNRFKWDKKIEPLRFETAKLTYLKSASDIAEQALLYYFDVASALITREIAEKNMKSTDSLYEIGKKRFALTTIKESDLLNLRLEFLNNKTTYTQAQNQLYRSKTRLLTFLNLDIDSNVETILPNSIPYLIIDPDDGLELAKRNNPSYKEYTQRKLIAERNLEQTKRGTGINAGINASIGLNQSGDNFTGAYTDLLDQQYLSLSLSIPLLDWGAAKGKRILAERERDVELIAIAQDEAELEQEIKTTILEFNLKPELVRNSQEAALVAEKVYNQYVKRFQMGLVDVNTLILQQQRKDAAQKSYLRELQDFWVRYYKIRSLTLYDFVEKRNLTYQLDDALSAFDFEN